jgi:hypothetical protein
VGWILAALLVIALGVAAFWFLIRADSVETNGPYTMPPPDAAACNQATTTVHGMSSFSARFVRSEIPLAVYEGRVTLVYITPFDPPESWAAINLYADRGASDVVSVAQVHDKPELPPLLSGDCLRITGKLTGLDCGPACDAWGFVAQSIDVIAE